MAHHVLTRLPQTRLLELATRGIEADLAEVERIYQRTLAEHPASLRPILQHLDHYQGKRLRPILLLRSALACGKLQPAHHVLAAVVEMIHTATLVHDDVLDEASMRRHVTTVNARWSNKVSILLGDVLFTHAFHLSSRLGDATLCELIGAATNAVCAGEMRQVCEQGNLELSEADYLAIIEGKTAALTACCCQLGALVAGASPSVGERMADYGRALGMTFQIADDLLDLVGDEQLTGKTLGTDLQQGKLTLPMIHLLDNLPLAEASQLRQAVQEGHPGVVDRLRGYLARIPALDYARERAIGLAHHAADCLEGLPPSASRDILAALPIWGIRRER